ncbi:hypothetical protein P153DRAFT_391422 [Dothidotthia symphoricarpi CBS 119687]|uniref:Uncharacterized protein n=1 Tax=Dothidotthia symphoricarpi CBS 119687 TaxID=1392245 RepID=A0A6A5ZX40_9PLEO|nr:uncharacterized protein P153DRAFT_391422 [Dothidotthia symphoricarpi CBS 119687]KAF2123585.1 hypothetical protein P153DRAFT_391422 [Dothidotthia symphoricarpi CBS 119687]
MSPSQRCSAATTKGLQCDRNASNRHLIRHRCWQHQDQRLVPTFREAGKSVQRTSSKPETRDGARSRSRSASRPRVQISPDVDVVYFEREGSVDTLDVGRKKRPTSFGRSRRNSATSEDFFTLKRDVGDKLSSMKSIIHDKFSAMKRDTSDELKALQQHMDQSIDHLGKLMARLTREVHTATPSTSDRRNSTSRRIRRSFHDHAVVPSVE